MPKLCNASCAWGPFFWDFLTGFCLGHPSESSYLLAGFVWLWKRHNVSTGTEQVLQQPFITLCTLAVNDLITRENKRTWQLHSHLNKLSATLFVRGRPRRKGETAAEGPKATSKQHDVGPEGLIQNFVWLVLRQRKLGNAQLPKLGCLAAGFHDLHLGNYRYWKGLLTTCVWCWFTVLHVALRHHFTSLESCFVFFSRCSFLRRVCHPRQKEHVASHSGFLAEVSES